MVVTGENIILKRISPIRQNVLPALTLLSLYFLLRVYPYALVRNVPSILHRVHSMLYAACVLLQYGTDMVIVNGDWFF